VWVDTSSEFRYRNPLVGKNTLVILVSQSGETADTLAALREAKKKRAKTLAICNVLSSSIDRESDGVIHTHAGPEIAVASTKAYTAQLAILYLLTIYIGQKRKTMSDKLAAGFLKEFKKVPPRMRALLEKFKGDKNKIAEYAKAFRKYYLKMQHKSTFLYLARNINYPNALEGALKLKEISYIAAEGYPAGEMKHGPIALIDENPWVVCVAAKSAVYDKMLANIQEIKARGGIIIAIATKGDREIAAQNINYVIEIPETDEFFSPMLVAIPLQLLAYYVAREFGYDIDQPRNLAKSVQVHYGRARYTHALEGLARFRALRGTGEEAYPVPPSYKFRQEHHQVRFYPTYNRRKRPVYMRYLQFLLLAGSFLSHADLGLHSKFSIIISDNELK